MKINYGVTRRIPGKKKRYEGLNGTLEIDSFDWDRGDHRVIQNAIMTRHPGWSIIGYCPEKVQKL
jgi:hypothetical protein